MRGRERPARSGRTCCGSGPRSARPTSARRCASRRTEPTADVKGVLADAIAVPSRRKHHHPEDGEPEALPRCRARPRPGHRHRPRGDRQVVPRGGDGRVGPRQARGRAHHPDASGRGGGRAAGLPARAISSRRCIPISGPLYDALYDMLEPEKVAALTEKGAIEIAPLAYMRGRTLNDAFIILDEAQNTTSEQMKMFLTRLGFNSKMVITGDITQVDLPASRPRGSSRSRACCKGSTASASSTSTTATWSGTISSRRSSAPTTALPPGPPPAGPALPDSAPSAPSPA